jgi:hypothetical protein
VLKSVDAQGLADALTPYLADDEFAIEQGRINGERAWKTWDARVVTALMADLYRSLATTPNRSTAGAPLEAKRV